MRSVSRSASTLVECILFYTLFCLVCASPGYSQKTPATGYFVVSGAFSSTYQTEKSLNAIYRGRYDGNRWNVSQDGMSVVGSSSFNSAQVSYHVDYFWLNGPLAKLGGEQWHRRVSESIAVYVLGPPGTPFSLTYSWAVKTSAANLRSSCSTGYTLAYFQGPQTASVVARQVGLTPTQSLSGSHMFTGVTQKETITNPSSQGDVYSLATTFTNSSGIQTGDLGPTGCSPALFTGSTVTDARFNIKIDDTVLTPLPDPVVSNLDEQLKPLLPVYNQLCTSLLTRIWSASESSQTLALTLVPTCLANIALHKIINSTPDPEFAVIEQPFVRDLPLPVDRAGTTQYEADALNALKSNQLQAAAYANSILLSLQRSQGASLASDYYWMHKQDEARVQFTAQLGAILDAQPVLLKNARNALAAAGFGPFAVTTGDVVGFKANLLSKGLSASVVQPLTSLGASASDIVLLQSILLEIDTSFFPNVYPDMLTGVQLLRTLQEISNVLLPDRCATDVSSTTMVSKGQFTRGSTDKKFLQILTLTNRSLDMGMPGPISLVLDMLSAGATLVGSSGSTLCASTPNPGSVFINVSLPGNSLAPGQSVRVLLEFNTALPNQLLEYGTRVLSGQGLR